jgi:hypothetical protein
MDLLSRDIKLITLKKDFFFQSKNKWKPFKNEFLNKFIKENLNIESKKKFVISKNSGNEKNSNNYLIEIKNKKYILKSINAKKIIKNDLKNDINFLKWLNKYKIKVPSHIKFKNSEDFKFFDNKYWILMSFAEGKHFVGHKKEFSNIVKEICNIIKIAKNYPDKKKLKRYYVPISFLEYYLNIAKDKKMKKTIGKKNFSLLNCYWKKIDTIIRDLKNIKFFNKHISPVHIDIHPLNIITRKNKLISIIDFNSWRRSSVIESLAYGGFKLCRQVVLRNKKEKTKKNLGRLFIRLINKYYDSKVKLDKKFILICKKVILVRIVNILKLNIELNDKSWNNFLPLMLMHLDEVEIIFDKNL